MGGWGELDGVGGMGVVVIGGVVRDSWSLTLEDTKEKRITERAQGCRYPLLFAMDYNG